MAKSDTKKKKRKEKKKQLRKSRNREAAVEKSDYLLYQAHHCVELGKLEKAATWIKKAAKLNPHDHEIFMEMGYIGMELHDIDLQLEAALKLKELEKLPAEILLDIIEILANVGRYEESLPLIEGALENFSELQVKRKRAVKKWLQEIHEYCSNQVAVLNAVEIVKAEAEKHFRENKNRNSARRRETTQQAEKAKSLQRDVKAEAGTSSNGNQFRGNQSEIPSTFTLNRDSFYATLLNPEPVGPERYALAIESHEIRFKESFENLISLIGLSNVRSLWYQEETARKVMKQFRGRALLSDEVGLGKTIEAIMIFNEYLKRGMIKSGLILTPTPLVSQWKEECKSKFGLDIPSTDDSDFKVKGVTFWEAPFVIASINQAKSKKNFETVTSRKYGIVIVDEAHHLKNRNTLNWKLVNALNKKFILLLTATPVENNLMELYNLITLLKPGQLETATSFREKFMQKGDPTGPRNRALLKDLLGEVMIRNTRALAGINIPPRFAETVKIEPSKTEKALYERVETLILELNESSRTAGKLLLKNLLAQAGSSPKALERTISKMLARSEYVIEHEKALLAVKNLCRTTLDTSKNKALMKLIRATGEKMIVFVKYIGTLEHLSEYLEWNGMDYAVFHGSMDNARKDAEIEAFKSEKQVLLTTEIGGEGRNLQFCNRMVNYDLPWNPMKIEQRIGRIHRIGQEKEVYIYNFCAAETVEDYILDILDRKINMFEMVIGEIDMIIGRMRGEKDFGEMVFEIWVDSKNDEERKKAFNNLGARLKRAKSGYEKTRALDDQLFGDTYEL